MHEKGDIKKGKFSFGFHVRISSKKEKDARDDDDDEEEEVTEDATAASAAVIRRQRTLRAAATTAAAAGGERCFPFDQSTGESPPPQPYSSTNGRSRRIGSANLVCTISPRNDPPPLRPNEPASSTPFLLAQR